MIVVSLAIFPTAVNGAHSGLVAVSMVLAIKTFFYGFFILPMRPP